jgi:glyoxylase-like metal-dependent hydrolase (beta-lactamase superfamily II)
MKASSEIADGLFKIADSCQVMAVRCPEGVLLVDAGMVKGFDDAQAALKQAGLEPPKYVLITHNHYDHTEAAHKWREQGAQIIASEIEAAGIEDGMASRIPCPVDVRLRPDQDIELLGTKISALSAPGHTPGSIAYDMTIGGERWLFIGDLVMLNLCPGWLGQFSLDDTLATLRKLARRPVDSIATGHSYARGDGTGLLVAAFDGTWYHQFPKLKDQFRDGKIPEAASQLRVGEGASRRSLPADGI